MYQGAGGCAHGRGAYKLEVSLLDVVDLCVEGLQTKGFSII